MTPKLSVLVPVYKTEKTLPSCLNSLLMQEGSFLEFILVDDSERGDTTCQEIIKPYLEKDSRLIYLSHNENRGLVETRITGINHSKGEYLLFLDSDDILLSPSACSTLINEIKKRKVDILRFGVDVHTTASHPPKSYEAFKKRFNSELTSVKKSFFTPTYAITSLYFIDQDTPLFLWGQVIKSEVAKNAVAHIPSCYCTYHEVVLFSFFFSLYANSFDSIPTKLYQWNMGEGLSTKQNSLSEKEWKSHCSSAFAYKIIFSWLHNPSHLTKAIPDQKLIDNLTNNLKAKSYKVIAIHLTTLRNQIPPESQEEAKNYLISQWGEEVVLKVELALKNTTKKQ